MSEPEDKPKDDTPEDHGATARGVAVRAAVAAIGLALAVVILIDWNAIRFEGAAAGTDDAQLRGNPVRLESRVSGLVMQIGADDDQPVRKGQMLYRIEQDTYRADAAQNRALLQQAEAQVVELQARIAAQRATVAQAAATTQASGADLVRAQQELARQNALRGTEGGVVRDWQQAAADTRRGDATVTANRDATRQAEAQIGILQAQLQQAQATAAAQGAGLDLSNINLGYTEILAPADGTVTARLAYRGEFVTPGRELITFIDLADIWAVAYYREEQMTGIRVGQRAELHVDAYPGVTLAGHVNSIGPATQSRDAALPPDRATGNFTKVVQRIPVKITLDAGHPLAGRLLPGLSVEAHIFTSAP